MGLFRLWLDTGYPGEGSPDLISLLSVGIINSHLSPSESLFISPIPGLHLSTLLRDLQPLPFFLPSFLFFFLLSFLFFSFFLFSLSLSLCLFRASTTACANSQARGQIGATAARLRHSHSNTGSEPYLRPTPQLSAMLDPWPTDWGQGSNSHPHGY